MDIRNTVFVKSAAEAGGFVRDGLPQITFAGRSNVGKSSVINCLVRRKNLARVGSAPGKTSQVNYFKVEDRFYLTDLPGYGYAKVSKAERERWGRLMEAYFASGAVTAGVLIVDARHKPTADDVTMMDWFRETGCPVVLVANKCDKVKKSELAGDLAVISETLAPAGDALLIPFSAETGAGRDALAATVEKYAAL